MFNISKGVASLLLKSKHCPEYSIFATKQQFLIDHKLISNSQFLVKQLHHNTVKFKIIFILIIVPHAQSLLTCTLVVTTSCRAVVQRSVK